MTHRQQLLWIPQQDYSSETDQGAVTFNGTPPTRVWMLPHTREEFPPSLPYTPDHWVTAWQSHAQDWRIECGQFFFSSRVHNLCTSGVWLLLEWE